MMGMRLITTEFGGAVLRDRYIDVCYGPPRVGKALSARRDSHWDTLAPFLSENSLSWLRAGPSPSRRELGHRSRV